MMYCAIVCTHMHIQIRLDGMRHLLQFPSGDLITCENWGVLHQAIQHALMDSDTQLSVRLPYSAKFSRGKILMNLVGQNKAAKS